jgi:squalene cyclase
LDIVTDLLTGIFNKRDHLGHIGINERKKKKVEDKGWIELTQDRVQWQAPVNTIMNLWVP